MALMELAEAFGVSEDALDGLLPLAMDGRLYLSEGRAVYALAKEVTLGDGDVIREVRLREPNAGDYIEYNKGMSVSVKEDKSTEVSAVMMTRRTIRAVDRLGSVKGGIGIVERFSVRDIRALEGVCDALGFFE